MQIGIDPGTHTGIALADDQGRLINLWTFSKLYLALDHIRFLLENQDITRVIFEDARLWKVHKAQNWTYGRLMGAGSVKRDSVIWDEFLTDMSKKYDFQVVRAQPNQKRNAIAKNRGLFMQLTGYEGRTSEHARCAAMLIFQNSVIITKK